LALRTQTKGGGEEYKSIEALTKESEKSRVKKRKKQAHGQPSLLGVFLWGGGGWTHRLKNGSRNGKKESRIRVCFPTQTGNY